jgi:hypothetical protein
MDDIKQKYPSLRGRDSTQTEDRWSIDNLRDGLNYFFDINGRYPTVKEVDVFEYLPTSRTIQRSFGGMMQLRRSLGLNSPVNFSSGETRSSTAREADLRARKYEEEFYRYLTSQVEEMRVHEHKIIRPGDTAADFFVYKNDSEGIVIDLFYARDMHSLGGIVNIKLKKYTNVKYPVYFVLVGNEDINQRIIDEKVGNRKNQLPTHIKVLTENNFKDSLRDLLKI